MDMDQVADWMVDNRLTGDEQKAKKRRDAIPGQAISIASQSMGSWASSVEGKAREDGEKADEVGGRMGDLDGSGNPETPANGC